MNEFWRDGDYVSVAERRRQAAERVKEMSRGKRELSPIVITGRSIATTFWGQAWCRNLESYLDFETRLPRGRSYVRNGAVIDLRIAPGEVKAQVLGTRLYRTKVTVKPIAAPHWQSLCRACTGRIDSLVGLLQGRLSDAVMAQFCSQETGLFPRPAEIQFSCSCPDWADMCKHVAAVLYGVGARLDAAPDLLFSLRSVAAQDLVAGLDTAAMTAMPAKPGRRLEGSDLATLFGLDIASEPAVAPARPRRKSPRKT